MDVVIVESVSVIPNGVEQRVNAQRGRYLNVFVLYCIWLRKTSRKVIQFYVISQDSCIEPGSDIPCNGRGDCECGKCACNTTVARFSGRFCEKCPVS